MAKFAAIGTDGTRPVVWGAGDTAELAVREGNRWAEIPAGETGRFVTVELTIDQVARVEAGEVSTDTLGIKLTPRDLREIA